MGSWLVGYHVVGWVWVYPSATWRGDNERTHVQAQASRGHVPSVSLRVRQALGWLHARGNMCVRVPGLQ